jgi:Ca-activated chloride channel family protein
LTFTATGTSATTQPEAAQMAADRGVRIYVVGLGTPDGHAALGDGMAMYLQLDDPRCAMWRR